MLLLSRTKVCAEMLGIPGLSSRRLVVVGRWALGLGRWVLGRGPGAEGWFRLENGAGPVGNGFYAVKYEDAPRHGRFTSTK